MRRLRDNPAVTGLRPGPLTLPIHGWLGLLSVALPDGDESVVEEGAVAG